jgi:hypothetical protein
MKYLIPVIALFIISCGNTTPPKPDPKKSYVVESKSMKIEGTLTDKAKFGIELPILEFGIGIDLLDNK